jgi:XTP/dITP diphosphohydrolase
MPRIDRLLVATTNPGKAREIAEILGDLGLRVAGLEAVPWVPLFEEGDESFADGARAKAAFYSRITGWPTLGDDSGLEVDALGGAPGVRSARWAGPGASDADRIAKLLGELAGVPPERRTARFRCAVSLVAAGREVVAAEGSCEGRILEAPRGTGGFGYDPVFLVPELNLTFAELPAAEKNGLSHRGRALAALRQRLAEWLRTDA